MNKSPANGATIRPENITFDSLLRKFIGNLQVVSLKFLPWANFNNRGCLSLRRVWIPGWRIRAIPLRRFCYIDPQQIFPWRHSSQCETPLPVTDHRPNLCIYPQFFGVERR